MKMESVKNHEEIRYCTTCGAANKKSAHTCSECKNKMHKKHRPFFEFLKRRVKGWGFDKAKGKAFDLIKDFLYSHLYGVVLTVSVVTTGSIVLSNSTPYIKNVNQSPFVSVSEEEEESGLDEEYKDWCEKHAIYMMSHYIDHSEAVIWAHDGYTVSEDNISLDEIYAERAIPGFPYRGTHAMMTDRVPLGMYHDGEPDSPRGVTEISDCVDGSYKFGEQVTSSLGQTLYNEGYEVMECLYEIGLYEGLRRDGTLESEPVEMERFRVLFVRYEDNWYIAEEVLTDRIKGQTYDIYMQYGVNGYVTHY